MRASTLRLLVCGLALAATGSANAKEAISLVHPTDPAFEASMWPITAGKVTSDKVDIAVSFTSIPAVIQAATTQQYDYIPTVTNILPRLMERGVPIRIMATNMRYSLKGAGSRLYVAAASPIKSVADLRHKTIGVSSLSNSGVTAVRVVLSQVHHANVALDGGDFKWVEMPLALLQTALTAGRVDAAVFSNNFDYDAERNKDFRLLMKEGLKDALGAQVPATMMLSYEPKLKARPDAFAEANRMLKDSAAYVRTHHGEVFEAVARKHNIDAAYLRWYYEYYADIPYDLTKGDLAGIEAFWGAVQKLKMIGPTPNLKDLVWDRVTVE
jgi:ABC-type nitrate/sulfonate/bicarbonate transport system substrate-binding protein